MSAQTSIGANDGRIQSVVTLGETGPFAVDFPFFSLDDVVVTITDADGTITSYTRGVHYNIDATANDDGIYPSGNVNWLGGGIPVAGTLTRYRLTALERASQLPLTGYLNRAAINADLNRVMAAMQDFDRKVSSALRYPEEDAITDNVLQPKDVRAGLAALFDSEGRLVAGAQVTGITTGSIYSLETLLPLASKAAWVAELAVPALGADNNWTGVNDLTGGRAKVPTRAGGDNGTDAANTAFVQSAIAGTGGATTGDVILTMKTVAPTGWIIADDGSIGSATSGATTRANTDTQALYYLLWANFADADAPVTGSRGATKEADWAANKKIGLPKLLGYTLGVAGAGSGLTSRTLGHPVGAESTTLAVGQVPNLNVSVTGTAAGVTGSDVGGSLGFSVSNGDGGAHTIAVTAAGTTNNGGGGSHTNMQPTQWLKAMVKL